MPKKKVKYSLTLGVDCLLCNVEFTNVMDRRNVQCYAGETFTVISLGRYLNNTRYATVIGAKGIGQIEYNEAHIMKELE